MYISKRILILSLLIILILSATTWVFAQVEGVIYACVNPAGAIRVVEDSTSCMPKENLIEWNNKGEKGDKGDQGDVGPAGVLDFYVVEGEHVSCTPGIACSLFADCNQGDSLTGGGVRKAGIYYYDDYGLGLIGIEPYYDSDKDQWSYVAYVNNQFSFDQEFWVYAICAQLQ